MEVKARRIPELEGLRALACLSIQAYHTLLYEILFCVTPAETATALQSLWFLFSFGAVDVFFMIQAFLTTRQAISPATNPNTATAEDQKLALPLSRREFFLRKVIIRLYLPFFLLVVLYTSTLRFRAFRLGDYSLLLQGAHRIAAPTLQPEDLVMEPLMLLPFSLLFLNNLLPMNYISWTWSMGPQFHFLFVFPWAVERFPTPARAIRAVLWGIMIVFCLRLAFAAFPGVLSFGVVPFVDPTVDLTPVIATSLFYNNTILRFTPFLVGALAALLFGHTERWVEARRGDLWWTLAWVPVGLLIYCGNFGFQERHLVGAPRYVSWLYITLVEPGGTLSSLAWGAFLVMLILRLGLPGRLLATCLSHRAWVPLADASYHIFLAHMIAIEFIGGRFLRPVPEGLGQLLVLHLLLLAGGLVTGLLFKALADRVVPRLESWIVDVWHTK